MDKKIRPKYASELSEDNDQYQLLKIELKQEN